MEAQTWSITAAHSHPLGRTIAGWEGGVPMPLLKRRLSLDTIRQQVIGINQKVPVYDGRYVHYVNLDNAATHPRL